MIPVGAETFLKRAYSPAQTRTYVNTTAQKRYASLRGVSPTTSAISEQAYLDLFLVHQKVPLYESRFLTPKTPELTMAALDGEYGAAGLAVATSFKEPPDHAAVELEFMSFLCGKEAEAWSKRSLKDGVKQLEAEAGFLGRHLYLWFPVLAEQVARHAGDGFYTVVTRAAHDFIGHDQALLDALLMQYHQEASRSV
jgi:TorA maturation chaperone TorD